MKKKRKQRESRPTPRELPRHKRWMFTAVHGLLLVICSLLLLLVLELIAMPFAPPPTRMYTANARLNHSWPPNSHQVHDEWIPDNPEFPTPYTHFYNAQSWVEDYDVSKDKPASTYRIFYLGDSFIEGCVPMEDTVPSQVERHLNTHHTIDGSINYEVINTGTSSYSPTIYYILARYFLLNYSPDALVVSVDMTDCFDDWKYRSLLVLDDEGNPFAAPHRNILDSAYVDTLKGAVKATYWSRANLYLFQNSSLYNLIIKWTQGADRSVTAAQDVEPVDTLLKDRWLWCGHDWNEETQSDVDYTLDLLRRLAELCDQHDVRLMITGVPHYQQFQQSEAGELVWSRRPHEALKSFAAEHGISYFDSCTAIEQSVTDTEQHEYYYRGDMHFNPNGFDLWAKAHIDAIKDQTQNMLPNDAYSNR